MDWLEKMNRAMDYIEENLTGEIDPWEIARRACCSEYHFRRMFSFIAGVPLSEYIRRRRLTLAAFDLQNSQMNVADAAVKYGYRSPDSFARAFHALHGINPSEVHDGASLKAWARMTFHLRLQGGTEMNYRIEEKEAFRIVGIKKRVPLIYHGVNPRIAEMWENLDDKTIEQFRKISNVEPSGIVSASVNFTDGRMEEQGELDHYIGAATTKPCPPGLANLEVPASTWAVFESAGPFPDALQDTWGRIFSEWFPTADYELSEGPEILRVEDKDTGSPDVESEIWIPVVKT